MHCSTNLGSSPDFLGACLGDHGHVPRSRCYRQRTQMREVGQIRLWQTGELHPSHDSAPTGGTQAQWDQTFQLS